MKIALIGLLLIVAAFVALMVTGSKRNAAAPGQSGNAADASTFNVDDYPAVSWLGSALGKFSPKLTLAQIQPSIVQYNLQIQPAYSLAVAADTKSKFRSAKFRVPIFNQQRCARLIYSSAGPPPTGLDSLREQDSNSLGDAGKKNPKTEVSFTILSSGGQITIARNSLSPQPCLVQLVQ